MFVVKNDRCQKFKPRLIAASVEPCSSLLSVAVTNSRGGFRKNERGGLVERGEAPYEGGRATQGVGVGGGASPSRLAGGEIFCFFTLCSHFYL